MDTKLGLQTTTIGIELTDNIRGNILCVSFFPLLEAKAANPLSLKFFYHILPESKNMFGSYSRSFPSFFHGCGPMCPLTKVLCPQRQQQVTTMPKSPHHGVKVHGLAQHKPSLALKNTKSCRGSSSESHGTLLLIGRWFGLALSVSIPHHAMPPITKCE